MTPIGESWRVLLLADVYQPYVCLHDIWIASQNDNGYMKSPNVYAHKSNHFMSDYRLNNEFKCHLSKDLANIKRLNCRKLGYDQCHWQKSWTKEID